MAYDWCIYNIRTLQLTSDNRGSLWLIYYKTSQYCTLSLLSILCILIIWCFNYVYKSKQNIFWQVGLYTFVVTTPWGWHLCAETCRNLCMSCMLYCEVHLLDILIIRTCMVWITYSLLWIWVFYIFCIRNKIYCIEMYVYSIYSTCILSRSICPLAVKSCTIKD